MSNGNNGKVLTVICKLARILTVSRKSHYPIETLLVVFEKFTRAYLFQIALEIIWLPILIGSGFWRTSWQLCKLLIAFSVCKMRCTIRRFNNPVSQETHRHFAASVFREWGIFEAKAHHNSMKEKTLKFSPFVLSKYQRRVGLTLSL